MANHDLGFYVWFQGKERGFTLLGLKMPDFMLTTENSLQFSLFLVRGAQFAMKNDQRKVTVSSSGLRLS